MEAIILIMENWALTLFSLALIQWYIIEKKHRRPNKWFWYFIRLITGGLFLWWFVRLGFIWYWAAVFEVFTFWFFFNSILNIMRGKPVAYLSRTGDQIDALMLKLFPAVVWWFFLLIAAIFSIGNLYFYGRYTWAEIPYLNF